MYKVYKDLTAKERKWKGLDKLKAHLDDKVETILEEETPTL